MFLFLSSRMQVIADQVATIQVCCLFMTSASKDSGLPTSWLPAQERTAHPMVAFLVLPGPIVSQGIAICYIRTTNDYSAPSILRNLTCSFKITAPTGRYISVYFRYFAISPSPNCSSSHLEVRDYRVSFAQHQVKGSRWRQ